ncbi:hypothetical protein TQ38_002700 [Novosphingobium sp. P6W]|jgi:saccharopine dehydrogenase-like NADP-dependent oxidoreductase|nr:hypothetical protein TQ38_002700 [Novosphingobium sp. P6W]KIS30222.1 hypothetical protein TQ38_23995 [Novosphingobium sp. P6W]
MDHAIPRACIAAGVHYIDIANSREFVCGIEALEAAAKDAGVVLLSGASSVPALSGAAVRHLAGRMDKVRAFCPAIYRVGLEYASSLTTAQPRLHPLRYRVMRET